MANVSDYEAVVKKGSQLLDMLLSDHSSPTQYKESVTQTKFTAVEDLSRYGYTDDITSCKGGRWIMSRLARAFEALGVNAKMVVDGGNNVMVEHQHLEDRVVDGVLYPATFATFEQVCNPVDGVLVAYNNSAAPHSGRLQEPPVLTIPPLHHWSDIAYLQWLSASSNSDIRPATAPQADVPSLADSDLTLAPIIHPTPIKYIFRLTIQNVATYSILNMIMTKHNYTTYNVWPGLTFSIHSEEGKAILGTPNGAGVAWLLAQQKKELGDRMIEKVTVFYAENENDMCRWPSLCFWVV